jgi:hypothetical protein
MVMVALAKLLPGSGSRVAALAWPATVTVAVVTPWGTVQSAAAPVSVKATVHWLAPPAVHDGEPASAHAVPDKALEVAASVA